MIVERKKTILNNNNKKKKQDYDYLFNHYFIIFNFFHISNKKVNNSKWLLFFRVLRTHRRSNRLKFNIKNIIYISISLKNINLKQNLVI